jgi:tetrathionate reductase subunit B
MGNKQYGIVVDLRRCAGCHACTVSCKSEHNVPLGVFRTKVNSFEFGTYPKVKRSFIPMMCNQCEDAPCLSACPTESIARDENGVVYINEETCTGLTSCIPACPYDAIYLHPETGVAEKCDFCRERLHSNLEPSCVMSCPTDAFLFGDLSNPHSLISKFIQEHDVQRLKEEEGTKPNVFYFHLNDQVEKEIKGVHPMNRLSIHSYRKEGYDD